MDIQDPALKQIVDQVLEARDNTSELYIRGGDTKAFYGSPPRGNPLDMRPLSGISSYEPTELVVTARAGTPLAELAPNLLALAGFAAVLLPLSLFGARYAVRKAKQEGSLIQY